MTTNERDLKLMEERIAEKRGAKGKKCQVNDTENLTKKSKYNNKKVEYRGEIFDSRKEFNRYLVLVDMSERGKIHGLERQVTIPIEHNGVKVCKYIADFKYSRDGVTILEDVKGWRGGAPYAMFRLKAKLVKAFYGIEIVEI